MASLRRSFHRWPGVQTRFHVAVVLTIVFVAAVGVPQVARFLDSAGGYDPAAYEPKDIERQDWLRVRPDALLRRVSWEDVASVGLFILVAGAWLTLWPSRPGRRGR